VLVIGRVVEDLMDAPPSRAAARIGSLIAAGTTPSGNWRKTGALETTLIPARRNLARSSRASPTRVSAIAV
jgi:hypothetical protein